MPVLSEPHRNEPCQICGDIGVLDAIITCSGCKNTREHVYCMRNYDGDVPSVWTCEACELSKETVSPKSGVNSCGMLYHGTKDSAGLKKFPNNSGRGCVSWEKRVDKGKTKYIPAQEAIRLSSGTKKFESPRTNFASSPPNTKGAISGPTPIMPNAITPKFPPPRIKANPTFGSSGHLKPPRQQQQTAQSSKELKGPAQASKELKGPAQASKELKENNAYPACMKEYAHMEQPWKSLNKPAEQIGTANRMVEKAMGKVSCSSSGSVPCPPKVVSGYVWTNEKHGNFVAENRNLINILPQVEKTLPSDPALHPSWKGSFKLPNSLNCGECHDEVQAHPPSRVRRKVYEFSKKMPEALEFKILPRHDIWVDIFQDDCPDKDDIGLYFFPSNGDKNENYISLLEFLSTRDLAMRNYINGVELLVFASVLLRVDFQKWNGNYFLWGVFRHVKTADAQRKDNREITLFDCPSIGVDESPGKGDDSEDVDMEIDMLGGSYVGKVDVVISKEPIRKDRGCFIAETATTIPMNGSDSNKSPAVSKNKDCTRQSPSLHVAKEMSSDIPPGFENCKQRVGSSGVCGSSSSEPQKRKYSDSPGELDKRRQAVDPTSAFSSPKPVKNTGFGSPGDQTCGQTDKKGFSGSPVVLKDGSFRTPISSRLAVSSGDNCSSGQDIPVKVKTEVL